MNITASSSPTLLDAPLGQRMRINNIQPGFGISTRLGELGFCTNVTVRCIARTQDKLICEIWDSRVGLDISAASTIIVAPTE